MLGFVLIVYSLIGSSQSDLLPFRNVSLSREERVDDLLSRLDLIELTQQLLYGGSGPTHGPAPAISRLGIGPYQWRSECLHGYGYDGEATSFPQAISIAASFDRNLIHATANATAYEARAKYNAYLRNGEYHDHQGIHCFSPVVNLLRHPLWGRNQETLGEDPYLSGELASAFVRGLSGLPARGRLSRKLVEEDHVYLTAASCKHFAVHSGPENLPVSRLSFEANVSAADMWMTFLPAFQGCLDDGVAQSIMCAYSGINGIPDCANRWLLKTVLREMMGFKGFVISDQGALQFLVSQHKAFVTYLEAANAAFKAGTNIENSQELVRGVYSTLPLLVASGVIKRHQLEEMNRPLFLTRMRQGEFDPPEKQPYASLNKDDYIQCDRHRRISLIAGCRSTVLLKNLKHFLPLPKKLKNLALIGPFAKSMDELIGSYQATSMPQFETPLDKGLQEVADVVHTLEFCDNGARCTKGDEDGLIKFLNISKSDEFDAIVLTIGTGSKFVTESRDNPSLQLFGQQNRMLELISIHAPSIPVVVFVYSGAPVNISAVIASTQVQSILWFGFPGQEAGRIAARMMLGNPGEGDSSEGSKITLRDPIGSSLESKEGYWWIPAGRLPFTWYESLSGVPQITDYDVSNYTYRFNQFSICPPNDTSSNCQLLAFPFGYGLSYNYAPSGSGFAYRNLDIPSLAVSSNVGFTFTVEVVNRGYLAAEEVVQVYLDWLTLFGTKVEENFEGKYKAASRQLVGFERIPLFPGEVKRLRFVVVAEQLKVWSYVTKESSPLCPANTPAGGRCGAPVGGSGSIRLSVGGQQPLQNKTVNSNVIITLLSVIDI
ncbi:hypothetical protein Aperf_G00000128684 [Anoplocephala perfoliata]